MMRSVDSPIRVMLADDQRLVRAGFRSILDGEDDINVVSEAGDGAEAVHVAAASRPDVVLMDIRMPVLDGLEATRRIVADKALSAVKVVILTTFDLDDYVYSALKAGASGFLVKDTDLESLTEREREVMTLVAAGLSNDEIATRLVVSPATAKTHVSRVLAKLGARDRAQLVVLAYESGMVRPGWLG
jgi:DNA-binding NarL/FixJ family response regulator